MKRKIAVCALSTSVFLILLSSFYFFLKRPEKVETPKMSEEEKKVIIVRDATYSSEKAGRIELRLKAKIAKKYIELLTKVYLSHGPVIGYSFGSSLYYKLSVVYNIGPVTQGEGFTNIVVGKEDADFPILKPPLLSFSVQKWKVGRYLRMVHRVI